MMVCFLALRPIQLENKKMKISSSVQEMIGNTPLVELQNMERKLGLTAIILAKVEAANPGGSAKDRVALFIIDEAEHEGRLKPQGTIIEPTSGNTGIGLAMIAAARDYHCVIVMPDNMSLERQATISAYGARLILTPASLGMKGAIEEAEKIQSTIPGSIIAGQFVNHANPKAHFMTTGPEIWKGTNGKVDILVAGVGTGGTITGAGRYLKQMNPSIKVVAVEPSTSNVLSGGKPGKHNLQGIGAGFIPKVLDTSVYDEVITVTDDDAYTTGRDLCHMEGLFTGITSGAAVWAASQLAGRKENEKCTIVAILPDSGSRYLSTPLFQLEEKVR